MKATSLNGFLVRDQQNWHQCLENSNDALRCSWHGHWVGLPLVVAECVRFLGLNDQHLSKPAANMLKAAEQVAQEIEIIFAHDDIKTEPCYHNRLHFADAITTMSVQVAIQSHLQNESNPEWSACALLTCIAHDLGHSGRVNNFESELEMISVALLRPILDECDVTGKWREWVEQSIIQSDFSIVHKNHTVVKDVPFEWDFKWLNVFLNEADVMASASTKFGTSMGEALAREWKKIGFVAYKTVATPAGRKGFLKNIKFSSPASQVLGIQAAIANEINTIL